MDHKKGITYAPVTASFWGFMAIVLKFITYELPPVTVVWFRFFFAFLVALVFDFTSFFLAFPINSAPWSYVGIGPDGIATYRDSDTWKPSHFSDAG